MLNRYDSESNISREELIAKESNTIILAGFDFKHPITEGHKKFIQQKSDEFYNDYVTREES